jgi:hypothetical protein
MPLDYRTRSRGDDVHFDRKGKAALQRRRLCLDSVDATYYLT